MARNYVIRVGSQVGATAHVISPTDALGLTDSRIISGNRTLSPTDNVGITQVLTPTLTGSSSFPTHASAFPRLSRTTTNSSRTPGAGTYNRVHFTNGVDLSGNTGGTYIFNDCEFTGTVVLGYIGAKNTRVFNYCEINGNQAGTEPVVTGGGFSMDHSSVWNGGEGVQAQDFDLADCWIDDLYGAGAFHGEPVLILGSEVHINHCTLMGRYRATAPGFSGGMSASVAMYTHDAFWEGHTNVLVENCLMQADAVFTVYWGTNPSNGSIDALINCDLINNTFRRWSPGTTSNSGNNVDITFHFPTGSSGNSITGNVYENDGTPVATGAN